MPPSLLDARAAPPPPPGAVPIAPFGAAPKLDIPAPFVPPPPIPIRPFPQLDQPAAPPPPAGAVPITATSSAKTQPNPVSIPITASPALNTSSAPPPPPPGAQPITPGGTSLPSGFEVPSAGPSNLQPFAEQNVQAQHNEQMAYQAGANLSGNAPQVNNLAGVPEQLQNQDLENAATGIQDQHRRRILDWFNSRAGFEESGDTGSTGRMGSGLDRQAFNALNINDPFPGESLQYLPPGEQQILRQRLREHFKEPAIAGAGQVQPGSNIGANLAEKTGSALAGLGPTVAEGKIAAGRFAHDVLGVDNGAFLDQAYKEKRQAEELAAHARKEQQFVAQQLPQTPVAEAMTGTADIGIKMGAAALGAWATGNPKIGQAIFSGLFATDAAGSAYQAARERGASDSEAQGDAVFSGIKAALIARLPMSWPALARETAGVQMAGAYASGTAITTGDATLDEAWKAIVRGEKVDSATVERIGMAMLQGGLPAAGLHGLHMAPRAAPRAAEPRFTPQDVITQKRLTGRDELQVRPTDQPPPPPPGAVPIETKGAPSENVRHPAQERPLAGGANEPEKVAAVAQGVGGVVGPEGAPAGDLAGNVAGKVEGVATEIPQEAPAANAGEPPAETATSLGEPLKVPETQVGEPEKATVSNVEGEQPPADRFTPDEVRAAGVPDEIISKIQENQNATPEGPQSVRDIVQHPGDGEGGTPPKAGDRGGAEAGAAVAGEAKGEVKPPERPENVTSIKNEQTAKERAAAGLPERVKPPVQGFDPVWKEAVKRTEADPNASRDLIARLKANPEQAVNPVEQDMVLHRRLELANDVKRLTRERNAAREAGDPVKAEQLGAELATAQDQYKEALEVGERIGTTTGRTLTNRKKYVDTLTFDLAHMIASEEGAKGRKLTAPEREQVEALHKKIEEAEAAHAEALAGKDARIAELESQRDHAAKVKEKSTVPREPSTSMKYGSRNRIVTREAYEKTRGELQNATFSIETIAAKALKLATFHVEAGARSFAEFSKRMIADVGAKIAPHLKALYSKAVAAVGPEYRDRVIGGMKERIAEDGPTTDLTRYIGELHKSFIAEQLAKDGKSTRDASLNSVHDAIKDIMPEGWTKSDTRDAMSGRGKTVEMSQDEVSVARRKEKGELLALGHLEGLAKTPPEAPPHTGLQRDKPGAEKRQLDKKVRDKMNELGVNVTDPETQLAGMLNGIKSRLKNEIEDLDFQITTGKRSDDTRTPVEYDPEAKDLKAQRDAKKATLDELFPKEAKKLTPEEQTRRALKMAESQAKQAEKRLAEAKAGNFKKPDGTRITGPEIEAMRAKADAANQEAAALRDLDLDVREARQVKDLESRIQKLQEGTKAEKTIRPPDTAKVAELRAELEKLQAARATPKKTPEEIAIAVRRAAKARAIADYSDRLARGDFAAKTRPERTETDPGTLRLAKIAADAKAQWLKRQREHELANRSLPRKIWDGFKETLNVPRMLMTSMDVSAVLRQGGFIAFGHPLRAAKAIGPMMRSLVSEQAAFNVMHGIENRPNAPLYDKSKLFLAKRDEGLNAHEEAFMSRLAGKIPGIKQSERAYNTFLNKLRADSFDAMLANLSKDGRAPTHEEAMAVANYVNIATGRGKLGKFENAAQGLNTIFFAARNAASRFQLIAGQPFYGGNAKTRGLIAKEYARFLIGAGVVYTLGAAAGGTVEKDPRSADFGKIKFGNTRMDPLAGLSQVSVLLSRLATGKTKSAASGLVSPIRGPGVPYGGEDSVGLIGRFLRNKLAPVPSAALNLATGKDAVGNKVTVGSTVQGALTPLVFSDIYSAMKDQGVPKGAALGLLTLFGMSMQTYDGENANAATPAHVAKAQQKIEGAEFRGELPENVQKLLSEHSRLSGMGVGSLSDAEKRRRNQLAPLARQYKSLQLQRAKGDKNEVESRTKALIQEAAKLEGT